MPVAESGEFVGGATEIERTGRIEVRHQHALLGIEDLRRLAHETHAGDHKGRGALRAPKARHLQRIGDAAAGFLGKVLNVGVDVVMREQYGAPLSEQPPDAGLQFPALLRARRFGHFGPSLRGAGNAGELALELDGTNRSIVHALLDSLRPAALQQYRRKILRINLEAP